ncbi:NAD(P)-dependent dehydrogenase, short-chain alcohol dehydrogenase family [Amycolatopsis arida]|uniref:NAD(P)-dependent dehydrogenase, short-chain alcohol dehydrogenase family n=1 Tax=Amycolatopsis arida TaxID=587909 RepID=A0A1I6A3J2_9PSEU|nr:SDR family oxidoreductase [Amycolatopsis arida]TDX88638.1 NAD(P)-dependent dehydrogenase (short-subunit alcohol dehydrogenase family) [Amycolatopsis arida]SFQ63294.1 NAD(P)-dependent dehydrogenase, short-chain alcohol dehydrogenase family [Amycolatopsis arida]
MGLLDGKAVVITGAGQGLGRAYAEHAARAGASVLVNDVEGELAERVARGILASGGRAVADVGSVADPDYAGVMVGRCVAQLGGLDGLVNNAAVVHHAPPWRDDPERLRAVIEVNVLGSMYCGTAAARAMHAAGRGGVIVNVASGSMLGQEKAAAYSASKGAVASMTASWAVDLAEHGIRVNAICPLAWTKLMREDPKAHQRSGPAATPERIAPLVTYLLSDLSVGITGQLIRFIGETLHIVRQPAVKEPVLRRDRWEVEDIARAFAGELAGALEPPPATRWGR